MLTLYFAPGACSMASHIALEEAGATFEGYKMGRGEQGSEWYRKEVNPRGQVPALRVDGTVLTENFAILCYVAKLFPAARLLPEEPFAYAQTLSVMAWMSNTVHPAFSRIVRSERYAGEDPAAQAGVRETARKTFWQLCQEIDARLSGKTWIMGEQFTLADPYALVFYGWCLRAELPARELANYTAFKDRMAGRPAVRRVLEREQSPLLG